MPTYPFTTRMRLDVEDPTLLDGGADSLTRIANPTGVQGGWGWLTQTGFVRRADVGGLTYLEYTSVGTGAAFMVSEPMPVTAGTTIYAAWTSASPVTSPTYWYRASLRFYNATGAQVGATAQTAILVGGVSSQISPAVAAPAGAVTMTLRFDLYDSAAGANPATTLRLYVTDVNVRPSPSAAPGPAYRNILTSATEITIDRADLNVGTLAAVVPDAAYDPATTALLRPGRRIRLVYLDQNDVDQAVFAGKVTTAAVQYQPRRSGPKRAVIRLTAADLIADLANVPRPGGVGTVDGLRAVMEGAGVPWRINGDTGQVPAVTFVTRNDAASALDQIAVTRDSVRGFAWMSRGGVLNAYSPGSMPTTLRATLTETAYGDDLDVSFDVEQTVNVVNVRLLRPNAATGETVEVAYGPYRHETSVREWGPHAAEFTVQGLTDSDTAARAYADAVFAASAVPQIRVNRATLLVDSAADADAWAALDLYDLVRVTNAASSLDQTSRITAITHRITPRSWLIDLSFQRDGGTAPPQATPAVESTSTTAAAVDWVTPVLSAPFTAVSGQAPRCFVDEAGNTHVQGAVERGTASSGATVFVLPTEARPSRTTYGLVRLNTVGAVGQIAINTAGEVALSWAGTPTAIGVDIVFTTR